MTQEEKAKAYDEALEKAREIKKKILYSHLSTESCKAVSEYIDTIIPELAESEDEKAKKIIASVFSEAGNRYIQKSERDIVLAYLEKQKEQKPVALNKDAEKTFEDEWKDYYNNCLVNRQPMPNKREIARHFYWFAEQKYNKPVEKQDYSGLNDFERAIHRGFLCAGLENVPVTIIKETAQDCLTQIKPVEWSEEDTEMYINVASSLRGYACGLENEEHKKHIKKGLDWLENRFKSLRQRKKEDLPKWKKGCNPSLRCAICDDIQGRKYLAHDGYKIYISELVEKLPKEEKK